MELSQPGLGMPRQETHLSPALAASVISLNPHFNSQVLDAYPHLTGEETKTQGGSGPSPGHTAGRVQGKDWSPSAPAPQTPELSFSPSTRPWPPWPAWVRKAPWSSMWVLPYSWMADDAGLGVRACVEQGLG